MTTVLASTDALPELEAALARRRAQGLDTYDEWWEGVYRIVTGPTPEHGRVALRLGAFLDRLCEDTDLLVSAPVNIGRDKGDARVPDIGVVPTDVPRTSPAFVSTAVLVVEVLSPGEVAGEKLDFYARWGVGEYLEVDLSRRTVRLLVRTDDTAAWAPTATSPALRFTVDGDTLRAGDQAYTVDWLA